MPTSVLYTKPTLAPDAVLTSNLGRQPTCDPNGGVSGPGGRRRACRQETTVSRVSMSGRKMGRRAQSMKAAFEVSVVKCKSEHWLC